MSFKIGNRKLSIITIAIVTIAITISAFLLPAFLARPANASDPAVDNLGLLQMGTATGGAHIQSCTGGSCGTGLAWAQIFNSAGGVVTLGTYGVTASFIAENPNLPDNTVFVAKSNKNGYPISSTDPCFIAGTCPTIPLTWGTGNTPAKDVLTNVYEYAATNPANQHLIIYTGFERIAPNGDSHIDIEFYQNQVHLDQTPPCPSAPCFFVGQHTPGDVVVSMEFLVGGSIGNFSARTWTGSSYSLVSSGVGEGCNIAGSICAFNNGANIAGGSWPSYDSHGNVITMLPGNAFTNFGIDVTALLGSTPCFSTTIGKTRSSGSFTAELKDFAGPTAFNICSAHIKIAPNAVNEVGVRHTFTVTFTESIGQNTQPVPDGTKVSVVLTNANGASFTNVIDNCGTNGTVGGTCTVSFTSFTAGTVTGTATGTVIISGVPFTATTNGKNNNSFPAVKTFVDARIGITPNGVNSINEPHTFTASVTVNDGSGAGFVPAASASITITLTPVAPLTQSNIYGVSTTCGPSTPGSCSKTFTSNAVGNVTGTATASVVVSGVTLTRTTNGGANTPPAEKKFVAGTLAWSKVDNVGNLLAGSTFEVCRTANFITVPPGTSGTFVPITPAVCITVTDNQPPDQNPVGGEFLLVNLTLGTYTVQETMAPPGFVLDTRIASASLTVDSPSATITPAFSNPRPILKLTGFGYTNTPTSVASQCPPAPAPPCSISGTTMYSITVTNFGGADALLNANLTVTISIPAGGSGSLTCPNNNCTLLLTNQLVKANGGIATATFTIQYSGTANVAISASLKGTYTTSPTDGLVRTVNGTPATISFTVQPN